jgi:hypothetical protein
VKEEQCYICKRTENEVRELLISNIESIAKKYDSEIIQITSTLQKVEDDLKSHVDAVLKIIENVREENLEFSLRDTYFDKRATFKKIIPNIDELEKIQDQYINHGPRSFGRITAETPFFVTRDIFMMLRKHMDDKNSKEHIEDLKGFQEMVMTNLGLDEPYLGLNLKLFERGVVTSHELAKSREEYKKIGKSINELEKLIAERNVHVSTLNPQLKSIEKLIHHKIFRSVLSCDGFFPKIGVEVIVKEFIRNSIPYGKIIETQFSIDVCAICYSLVWHDPHVELKQTPPLQIREPKIVSNY